jgi:hypothetical protein
MANLGKFKNAVVDNKTVTLNTSSQAQNEILIPNFGDIYAVSVTFSALATGTLSSASTLEKAINQLIVKDKSGVQLMQNIRGQDLLMLERFRNNGINRTIATISGSAQTETFFIPLNIEQKHQEAKIQLIASPYSDLATSGCTGGTLVYSLNIWYYDQTEAIQTEKIQRITKSANIGVNSFGVDLPKGIVINNIYFTTTTESYLTNIRFTGDGNKEMDALTPEMLKAIDNARQVSGHVTNNFCLYNMPFVSTPSTNLDFTNGTADTIQLFVVSVY